MGFQTLPPPSIDPYADRDTQSVLMILDAIGRTKKMRRENIAKSKLMEIVTGGDQQQEDYSNMFQNLVPQKGSLDFMNPFTPSQQPSRIEENVLDYLAKTYFQDPLKRKKIESEIKSTDALTGLREVQKRFLSPKKPTASAGKKRLSVLRKNFDTAGPEEVEQILKEAEDMENVTKTASAFFGDKAGSPAAFFKAQVKLFKSDRINVGKFDNANGKAVYEKTLRALLENALENGVLPSTVIHEFNDWWDKKAKEVQAVTGRIEYVPRAEFSPETEESIPARKPTSDKVRAAVVGGDTSTVVMVSPEGKSFTVPIDKKQKFLDNGFTEQ